MGVGRGMNDANRQPLHRTVDSLARFEEYASP
jgi:hypothetical protein